MRDGSPLPLLVLRGGTLHAPPPGASERKSHALRRAAMSLSCAAISLSNCEVIVTASARQTREVHSGACRTSGLHPPEDWSLDRATAGRWLGTWIRTKTNRVRVCCATVTPFPNGFTEQIQSVIEVSGSDADALVAGRLACTAPFY